MAGTVQATVEEMQRAWGDADAYGAVFTEDADYITFFGGHARGREEIAESHRPLFDGVLKGTTLDARITHVSYLAPDVALVHTVGSTAKRNHTGNPNGSVQTMVVVRQDGDWLIRAFQNTRRRQGVETMTKLMARFGSKR
jgi:uncharacterized protein (TIGR02246 family)